METLLAVHLACQLSLLGCTRAWCWSPRACARSDLLGSSPSAASSPGWPTQGAAQPGPDTVWMCGSDSAVCVLRRQKLEPGAGQPSLHMPSVQSACLLVDFRCTWITWGRNEGQTWGGENTNNDHMLLHLAGDASTHGLHTNHASQFHLLWSVKFPVSCLLNFDSYFVLVDD